MFAMYVIDNPFTLLLANPELWLLAFPISATVTLQSYRHTIWLLVKQQFTLDRSQHFQTFSSVLPVPLLYFRAWVPF